LALTHTPPPVREGKQTVRPRRWLRVRKIGQVTVGRGIETYGGTSDSLV
jgi:hypothetical protein